MSDEVAAKEADSSSTPDSRAIVIRNAGDFRAIYSNNVQIKSSVWDVLMDFGLVLESNRRRLEIESHVRIMMSPQHAKVFSALLSRQIERYEKQFGPIPSAGNPPPEDEEDE
jgi:hypothetical protein